VWLSPQQVQAARLTVGPAVCAAVKAPVVCAGKLSFDDERVVHVSAPVSGRISQIFAPVGAHVAAGGPLCSIRSSELAQAVAAQREALADRATAKRAYERQRTLYEGHAAAQKDFEAAHSHFVQAQAEYERSRQQSLLLGGKSQILGDTYVLRSPLEGNVVASAVHPGAEVQGQYNAGANVAELFVVGDLDSVWAMADVFEMDMHQVEQGDAVEVQAIAYPHDVFLGKVDWVADAVDPNTRAVRVRCRLDNKDHRLKPDMVVRMKILADTPPRVTIPRRALFRKGSQTVVFVVDPTDGPGGQKRFVRRPVQALEDAYGDVVPVVSGLAAGEQVVTAGGIILLGE
jgi:cobalt-zinc-cadmium efflux system membrane fusion protein